MRKHCLYFFVLVVSGGCPRLPPPHSPLIDASIQPTAHNTHHMQLLTLRHIPGDLASYPLSMCLIVFPAPIHPQVSCPVEVQSAPTATASLFKRQEPLAAAKHSKPSQAQAHLLSGSRELAHLTQMIKQSSSWQALHGLYLQYTSSVGDAQLEALLVKMQQGSGFARLSATQRADIHQFLDTLAGRSQAQFAELSPQTLSLLVATFGALEHTPSPSWLSAFLEHTKRRMFTFTYADLARMGRGLAQCSASPEADWCERFWSVLEVLQANKAQIAAVKPHHYQALLSSAASMGMAPSASLLAKLTYQVTLCRTRCSTPVLLSIVSSLAALGGAPNIGLMEYLLAQLREGWQRQPLSSAWELLTSAQLLQRLRYQPGDAWLGEYLQQAVR